MVAIGNQGHVILEEIIGIRINNTFNKGVHVGIEKDGLIIISSSVGNSSFGLIVDSYCCVDVGAVLFDVGYHYFMVPESWIFLVVWGLHYCQLSFSDCY